MPTWRPPLVRVSAPGRRPGDAGGAYLTGPSTLDGSSVAEIQLRNRALQIQQQRPIVGSGDQKGQGASMRTYDEEALGDHALPEFAPRYQPPSETRGRTPVDIIADALTMLHQDVAEYAFAGFIGAVAAAFVAVVLSTGGIIG